MGVGRLSWLEHRKNNRGGSLTVVVIITNRLIVLVKESILTLLTEHYRVVS